MNLKDLNIVLAMVLTFFVALLYPRSGISANTITKKQANGQTILDTGDGKGVTAFPVIGQAPDGSLKAVQTDADGNLITTAAGGGGSSSVTVLPNTAGSYAQSGSVGSGAAVTLSKPSNAVGFLLMASSSNSQNLRFAVGATPTTTSGIRLEPGRDTGYMPVAADIKVIAESGSSQEVQVQWVLSQ